MITIEKTISLLKADHNFREVIIDGTFHYQLTDRVFHKVSYDSRDVSENTLFFAKGSAFKREFLETAIPKGVSCYISEVDYQLPIPAVIVTDVKKAMSLVGMAFYGYPQNHLKTLAITGTKGKTTAAYFAYHILKQTYPTALLSTMNTTLDGGQTFFKSQFSTPENLDLFRMMAEAVKNGMTHLVMEVSSQAYLVNRVYGLTFDVGVFLNITPDHIGPIEHPSFEDYFYHKRLLLDNCRTLVINAGTDHFGVIQEQVADRPHDCYGQHTENTIINSQAFSFDLTGELAGHYTIQLIGHFNQENAVAAALATARLGASPEAIKKGIAETNVPGRMEVLTQANQAKVIVDYAHNGDSLDKLIRVVSDHQSGKRLLILGAPGNKGESRRADFGQVINRYPDLHVILTADDPNYEDPKAICDEIARHIHRPVEIIVNREEAIATAMKQTHGADDAVIIAGKGADAYQIVNGQKMAYLGDLEIAKTYL